MISGLYTLSELPWRPIVPERQGAEVLAALRPVDGVVIFDDPTATCLIEALKPDIYVKGATTTKKPFRKHPSFKPVVVELNSSKWKYPPQPQRSLTTSSTKLNLANS